MEKKPGRKPMEAIPYFPFDCSLLKDKKFRRVRQKIGYLGVIVYISVLTHVYGDKGYYAAYDEDLLWEIQQDLAGKYQPDIDTIAEVVELLVAGELFSADHFEQKYLTSKRIQESYYRATVERTGVEINFDIWMLSVPEMENISKKSFILQNFISRSENSISRSINSINQTENGQRKSKRKSKSKNNTDDEYRTTSIGYEEPSPSAPNLFDSFENEFGRPLTQIEIQEIAEFKEELPEEVVHEALKEAVLNQKLSFSYIRAILTSWKMKGIDTVEKAKKHVQSFKGNVSTANAAERTLPDWYSNPSRNETEGQEEVDMDEFNLYLNKIKESKKG